MNETDQLLLQLGNLDLKSNTLNDALLILSSLGISGIMVHNLEAGDFITRARSNPTFSKKYTDRSSLSYRPQKRNKTFQRASTPNNTMFYGSIVPEFLSDNDFELARITASLEATYTFRNNIETNHEKVTYSMWEVTKPIRLAMVCHHIPYLTAGSMLSAFNQSYFMHLSTLDPAEAEKSLKINTFISGQFAKFPIDDHREYMISALFSELAVKNGLDGVVYPSVRSDGRGLNVCLSKACSENKIALFAAGESRIMRNGLNPQIITESVVKIDDDRRPFKYEKIKSHKELDLMWKEILANPNL